MPNKPWSVTPEMHAGIIESYRAGHGTSATAEKYGVSPSTAYRHLLVGIRDGEIREDEHTTARKRTYTGDTETVLPAGLPEDPAEIFHRVVFASATVTRQLLSAIGLDTNYRSRDEIVARVKDATGCDLNPGLAYRGLEMLHTLGFVDVSSSPCRVGFAFNDRGYVRLPPAAYEILRRSVESGMPAWQYLGRTQKSTGRREGMLPHMLHESSRPSDFPEEFEYHIYHMRRRGLVTKSGRLRRPVRDFAAGLRRVAWAIQNLNYMAPLRSAYESDSENGTLADFSRKAMKLSTA